MQCAAGRARRSRSAVDGRADIYALGAMLYESLGGPLPVDADSPPLARREPAGQPGLSDVVARCLAARPDDRYPDAAALADDLRRHLTDQPLLGVANRSLAERWQKWRRRRPGQAPFRCRARRSPRRRRRFCSRVRRRNLRDRSARRAAPWSTATGSSAGHAAEAVATFGRGRRWSTTCPSPPRCRAACAISLSWRGGVTFAQLRQVADDVRLLYGAESIRRRRRMVSARCDALRRHATPFSASGADGRRTAVAADLQDVAISSPRACGPAPRSGGPRRTPRALRLLDEIEARFGGARCSPTSGGG